MEFISRFIALIFIAALSPLFLIISILSLFFQGSPIFFKQERIGRNFKPFIMYKFRTMKINEGVKITIGPDGRITYWGSFLRKIKLDELPQLMNILKGDMRFLGPRPEVPEYVKENSFLFLKKVKPGLSDYASILFRNEADFLAGIASKDPYREILEIKLELADYYVSRKSFLEDLRLVFLTLTAIFSPVKMSDYVARNSLHKQTYEKYLGLINIH